MTPEEEFYQAVQDGEFSEMATLAEYERRRMYSAIGRKLLMVSELPAGAMARYERDVQVKSFVLGKLAFVLGKLGRLP